MVTALDENKYDESNLVQIKLPLNLPYLTGRNNYERCDGNIVLNGIHYNYVKRLVQNDTMYLYCVPNQQKTTLNNIKTEYAKQSSDIPSGKKSEQPVAKRIANEYNANIPQYNFFAFDNCAHQYSFVQNSNTSTGFQTLPSQPPELIG